MVVTTATEPHRAPRRAIRVGWLLRATLCAAAAAAALFIAFPAIDLGTSAIFYKGRGMFQGGSGNFYSVPTTLVDALRMAFYICSVTVCVGTAIAIAASATGKRDVLGIPLSKWLFLGACLALGPGLVANVILKDHWGRARPVQIVEFGGTKTYSPPLIISDQCRRNCSFVAGEPSMVFAIFFAAAFLFPAIGYQLFAAGIAAGLFSGGVRIAEGGHFLSDVVFAGIAMALTAALLHLAFEAAEGSAGRNDRDSERKRAATRGS